MTATSNAQANSDFQPVRVGDIRHSNSNPMPFSGIPLDSQTPKP